MSCEDDHDLCIEGGRETGHRETGIDGSLSCTVRCSHCGAVISLMGCAVELYIYPYCGLASEVGSGMVQ